MYVGPLYGIGQTVSNFAQAWRQALNKKFSIGGANMAIVIHLLSRMIQESLNEGRGRFRQILHLIVFTIAEFLVELALMVMVVMDCFGTLIDFVCSDTFRMALVAILARVQISGAIMLTQKGAQGT